MDTVGSTDTDLTTIEIHAHLGDTRTHGLNETDVHGHAHPQPGLEKKRTGIGSLSLDHHGTNCGWIMIES